MKLASSPLPAGRRRRRASPDAAGTLYLGGSQPGAASEGTVAGLRYRNVSGTTVGTETHAPDGGVDWSAVRGAVEIDGTLFNPKTGSKRLYSRPFSPESGIVGPTETVAGGVTLTDVGGPTLDGVDSRARSLFVGPERT